MAADATHTGRGARLSTLVALVLITLAATTFTSTPKAAADTCHKFWKFTVCGKALNATNTTMHSGQIVKNGPTACTVYDPASPKPHNGSKLRCTKRSVAPGKLAPERDTDVIMFQKDFWFNDKHYKAGQWVKIRVAAACDNPPLMIVCFGI